MARYTFILLSSFAALMGIHVLLFWSQLGIPTESSRWLNESQTLKEQCAQNISGRKILIVSGSNSLFSLSAKELEAELGMPVVNCGLHGGLKLEYTLDRSRKLIGKGDIVVLPLEYAHYGYSGETGSVLSDFLTSRDPAYLKQDVGKWFNTAYSFSILELGRRNLKRFFPDKENVGYYDASHLNSHGDKTNISKSLMTERDRELLESYRAFVDLKFIENGTAAQTIGEYIKHCDEAGAHALVTFPTTIGFDEYESKEFLDQIAEIRRFVEEAGGKVIGQPSDFCHSVEYFFNTNYHANEAGRKISTDRMRDLLKDFIGETGIESSLFHN